MKKITILMLHLLHGGVEKQTIALANELSKKYEVEIISIYTMCAAPAYDISDRVKITYLMDAKPNRNEIKNAIKSKNPFKILKEGLKAVKILYLKKKLMIKEIKKLKSDFVLSTRIEYAEMLSRYAPKGIVTMTQEHLHDDSKKYVNRVKKAFRNLDYLIVLCDGSRENYSKWLCDNKKIKIVKIPNILNKIPSGSAELEGNKIVSVGRLHAVKNFETLISVFDIVKKEIPDSSLTIVGDGDEYDKLSQKIRKFSLEANVKITGMVSADEVLDIMQKSDLYVMTSHTECFPMVLLEASSVGLPLISFDVPVGPKSIIENDRNGYLCEYNNINQMAEKIISLLKDRQRLKNFGKCAKENSVKYLAENVLNDWYALFD